MLFDDSAYSIVHSDEHGDEPKPWLLLDLGAPRAVQRIEVQNRGGGQKARIVGATLQVCADAECTAVAWSAVFEEEQDTYEFNVVINEGGEETDAGGYVFSPDGTQMLGARDPRITSCFKSTAAAGEMYVK